MGEGHFPEEVTLQVESEGWRGLGGELQSDESSWVQDSFLGRGNTLCQALGLTLFLHIRGSEWASGAGALRGGEASRVCR